MNRTSSHVPPTLAEVEAWGASFRCLACGAPLPDDAPAKRTYCNNTHRMRYMRWRDAGKIT